MDSNSLVSVIIPCYNHEAYVEESILSVLNQTYNNIQLIVIDDGSKDKSIEIIQKLQATYHFIFEAQANVGLSATLNKAIKKYCTGEFICALASDDFWHHDKIKLQIKFLAENPQYSMIFSNAFLIDKESKVFSEFSYKRFTARCTFENLILDKIGIPALTVIVKKEVYNNVGLFDESLSIEDWDMWLRIADKYEIGFLNEKLAYYRSHDYNISSNIELMLENRFRILDKWKNKKTKLYYIAISYWQLYALRILVKMNKKEAKKYLNITSINQYKFKYYYYLFKYYFL